MTFHENPLGMTVFDGPRLVAKATGRPRVGWLLRMYNGSWVDPRARTGGMFPGKFPYLMKVKNKAEARKILKSLVDMI